MDKYKHFLAANVLNENRIVNYRTLSRALKVHANLAKQMLYDFHQRENAKKVGSVHATYLIAGISKADTTAHVNGVSSSNETGSFMQSSPFPSSAPEPEEVEEQIVTTTVMLAKEEGLEDAKNQFEEIRSIHIYSLAPSPIKDFEVLATCNEDVDKAYASEDPLQTLHVYGVIKNPNVKRRARRGPPPPNAAAAQPIAKPAVKPSTTAKDAASKEESSKAKDETESKPAKQKEDESTKRSAAKPAAPKREKSDLFKSFANAKTKTKTEASAPKPQEPKEPEDEPMKDVSEDEPEEDFDPMASKQASDEARKQRDQRAAQLAEMMDQEDEPMEDAPSPGVEEQEEEQEAPALEKSPEKQEPEKREAGVSVTNGRRRGKRKVMKRKTIKDEEGYMVTREEPVWESFSEDEPEPKKPRAPIVATPSTTKGRKGGPKGQGNIMSFFSKK
ncbi:DNA polymerase subunit Cdc27 [Lineolata rhizophorae]|uniref:DNA polymerase delta subunit 3 n=1 Tax=Lineolata rhizophorae TaxID=578093 RepID=A0A6A6P5X0_9PEZI|nr:DNA polymerase subunit Cdc27 [Lineolata rhizophorae]